MELRGTVIASSAIPQKGTFYPVQTKEFGVLPPDKQGRDTAVSSLTSM